MIMDSRYEKLAETLVGFSTAVKKGDRVLIDASGIPDEMILALMRSVGRHGGRAFLHSTHPRLQREFLLQGSKEDFECLNAWELAQIQDMQCYIALRGADNIFEYSDVPAEKQQLYYAAMKPAHDHRVNETRWVILRWPNAAMAQSARRSTEEFQDFFFRVCTMDYGRMKPGMDALKRRLESADRVHIKSPGTDLQFSIKGLPAIPCGGEFNIPDGELFTAPVRESVEGVICYNTPSVYHGQCFENVRFVFKNGKIVEATANKTPELNAILDSDEGARHIGEFAFGFNPHILEPMCDTLFDEKIAGSLHFTPGQAYENCNNGNRSQIHWDLVLIQRPDCGGGEIYLDGELIRKDGLFIPNDLAQLNPHYLLQSDRH